MEDGIKVAILVPLSFFALIFGIVYMYKRENMAMIERGMNPRLNKKPLNANYMLRLGLIIIGAGVGLLLATIYESVAPSVDTDSVHFSLIAIFGGLGAILAYNIEKKDTRKEQETTKTDTDL